jgi:nucleotide-binding universal stress UspA family protein
MNPATNQIEEKRLLIAPAHILVATDLSDQEQLMPHIVAQAKISDAFVTLVHAIKPGDCGLLEGCPGCGLVEEARAVARAGLEKMVAAIEDAGISCAYVLKLGFAADVVTDQIRISGATRLIMTSHGRHKMGQFLFGSVANQLLGRAGIPVFVVSPRCTVLPVTPHPRRILHPASLRENYRESASFAIELARKHEAKLTLLHICASREEMLEAEACVPNWREKLLAELGLGDDDQAVSVEVGYGDVVKEIRREALRLFPELIVMGVKEDTAMWPLPESSAYQVIAKATCPVLVIRHHSTSIASDMSAMPVRQMHTERSLVVIR